MSRKVLFSLACLLASLWLPCLAAAGDPVLFFSDITGGARTGLGDGKGSGAIVSVWGRDLGNVQGASKVLVGGSEAAYVYYWGSADGSSQAGPADLFSAHRMQTIVFSVPGDVPLGVTQVQVVVGGASSNALPFYVWEGNIFHVRVGGSDTGSGSWSDPWATLDYVGRGAGGRLTPGSIVYAGDGIQATAGFATRYTSGTADRPISLTSYPGSRVIVQGSYGIGNWNAASDYWNFSKLIVKTEGSGVSGHLGMRVIANEITNYPGGCANGQSGAITGANKPGNDVVGGIKALGNYIHDFGCDTTSKLHHVFYISNRAGFASESYELGWNYLRDNKAHHGLHVYDESICGDFSGVMRIHDNVVVNQVGVCLDVSPGGSTDPCFSFPVEVYNNLFVNCGLETSECSGHNTAISFPRRNNHIQVKFYNNTTYGYGVPGNGNYLWVPNETSGYEFAGTWEYVNNIVVDTNNLPFETTPTKTPVVRGNNIWYSLAGYKAPPLWEQDPLTVSPQFIDPERKDFRLQSLSPARNAGSSLVSAVVLRDLLGQQRGMTVDIGAMEHAPAPEPPVLRAAPRP